MATVVVEVGPSPHEAADLPVYFNKPTDEATREPSLSLELPPRELDNLHVNSNPSNPRPRSQLSEQELRDIPVYINPPKQDATSEPRARLNLILCIVLAINTALQFIALVTPGWNSFINAFVSTYESVYYSIGCVDITPLENVSTIKCEAITYLADFSDAYGAMADSGKPALAAAYNLRVRHQMNVQFSWILVAGSTILQIIKYMKRNEQYPKLTALSVVALVCACSMMYQVLFGAFVAIDTTARLAGYLSGSAGFPYSVLFYSIAFVQTFSSLVLIVKQISDYVRQLNRTLEEHKVQFDTLKKLYNAEVEDFKRFRQQHRDNAHLRPPTTRSLAADGRTHLGDHRPSSRRHSPDSRREYIHQPPTHSRNMNNPRHRELPERSNARLSRKHDEPHGQASSDHAYSTGLEDHSFNQERRYNRSHDRSPPSNDHDSLRPHRRSQEPRDRSPTSRNYSRRQRDYSPLRNGYRDQSPRGSNDSIRRHEHSPRPLSQTAPEPRSENTLVKVADGREKKAQDFYRIDGNEEKVCLIQNENKTAPADAIQTPVSLREISLPGQGETNTTSTDDSNSVVNI